MNEDTDKQMLDELRKLNAFNRRSLAFIPLAMVLLIGLLLLGDLLRGRFRAPAAPAVSWREVQYAMDREDNDDALRLAMKLMTKNPTNYYGEWYLGAIYHSKGDIQKAEQHYARAHDLFPCEDYEKRLTAIRKVLTTNRE